MRILAYRLGCILQSSALDLHGQSAVPESDHEQRHGGATGRLTQSTSRWPRPVPLAEATHPGSPRPQSRSWHWHPAHAARFNAGRTRPVTRRLREIPRPRLPSGQACELRRPHSELHWQPPWSRPAGPGFRGPRQRRLRQRRRARGPATSLCVSHGHPDTIVKPNPSIHTLRTRKLVT